MGKLLSWLLLGVLVWGAYRFLVLLKRRAEAARAEGRHPASDTPQHIVRCERCDVHVPRSEAIAEGKHYFCSEAHRDEARRAR